MKSLRKLHTGKPYVQFERRTEASVKATLRASSPPPTRVTQSTPLAIWHADTDRTIRLALLAKKVANRCSRLVASQSREYVSECDTPVSLETKTEASRRTAIGAEMIQGLGC
jgi:hypothetical protein